MRRTTTLKAAALALGLVSLGAQTVLFREHLLVYAGNELGVGVFLAAWMLWIGLGALVGRVGWVRRPAILPVLFCAWPLALALELWAFWNLRNLAGVPPTALFPLGSLSLWTTLAGAPVSLLTGLFFTWIAAAASEGTQKPGGEVMGIYAWEALGSALGGVGLTVALWLGTPVAWIAPSLAVLWLAAATLWALAEGRRRIAAGLAVAAGATLLAAIGPLPAAVEEARRGALPIPDGLTLVESVDTPYQNVTVARLGPTTITFSDGELAGAFPDEEALFDAAVLHTLAPDAPRTLVIGFGAQALVCELARRSDGEVVYVGVDGRFLHLVRQTAPPALAHCLARPNVQVVEADARRFLAAAAEGSFDLVVLATPEARTAQTARFYTREFFERVRRVVREEGLFSLDVGVTENVLVGPTLRYAGTLFGTLSVTFEEVVFSAGQRMRFFAGGAPARLAADPEVLSRRFERLAARYPELSPQVFHTLFETERIEARRRSLESPGAIAVADDDRPAVYLYNLLSIHESPAWFAWAEGLTGHLVRDGWIVLVGLLAAMLFAGRFRRGSRRGFAPGVLLFTAGAVGMTGQLLVILGYQARFGSLFAEFGLLNAAFMAGLGAGGLLRFRLSVGTRVAVPAALVVMMGLIAVLVGTGGASWLGQGAFVLASVGAGVAVGTCLRLATLELEEVDPDGSRLASRLELLDHTGAVTGAAVGGLLLVPLAGLLETALLLAGAAAVQALVRAADGLGWRPVPRGNVPALGWRVVLAWGILVAAGTGLVDGGEAAPAPEATHLSSVEGLPAPSARAGGLRSSLRDCTDIPAWGGPMELLVAMDEAGRVEEARLGRHRETPEYVYGMDEWLAGFRGRQACRLRYGPAGEPDGVDAFTGATVTGVAAVKIVRCMCAAQGGQAAAAAPGEALPAVDGTPRFPPWLGALLLALAGLGLYFRGDWRGRTLFLGIVVGLAGVLWNQQLALDSLLQALGSDRPPLSNLAFWGVLAGAVAGLGLAGAVFCGYLCPVGALSSLLGRVGLRQRPPPAVERALRQGKYALASLLVWGGLLAPLREWFTGDPLQYAFSGRFDLWGVVVLAGLLVASLVWMRPWCRYLCPLGAVLSLGESAAWLDRLAPRRRAASCHHGVRPGEDLDCVRCNRCVSRPLPTPRGPALPWPGTMAVAAVVLLLAAMGVRSAVRVASPAPQAAGSEPTVVPAGSPGAAPAELPAVDGADVGIPAALEVPEGPRLERKDNEAYPYQRRLGSDRIEQWIREGSLADREALYYLPVESGK